MKRRYVLASAVVLAIAILSSAVAFGVGLYFGGRLVGQPESENAAVKSASTTTASTTTLTVSTTTQLAFTASTIAPSPESDPEKQKAIIRALSRTFNPFPVLNITCPGGGGGIRLWADSVGFKVNVTNIGSEMAYVETTAETSRGIRLAVNPGIYNSVPGDTTEVSVLVAGKDVRDGDNITLTSSLLGKKRVLVLPVERSSDKYSEVGKSGQGEGCGAAATYDREH